MNTTHPQHRTLAIYAFSIRDRTAIKGNGQHFGILDLPNGPDCSLVDRHSMISIRPGRADKQRLTCIKNQATDFAVHCLSFLRTDHTDKPISIMISGEPNTCELQHGPHTQAPERHTNAKTVRHSDMTVHNTPVRNAATPGDHARLFLRWTNKSRAHQLVMSPRPEQLPVDYHIILDWETWQRNQRWIDDLFSQQSTNRVYLRLTTRNADLDSTEHEYTSPFVALTSCGENQPTKRELTLKTPGGIL